jgi:rhomboid-like protein
LDDPAFAAHTAQFSDEQIAKALEYLRKTVAVNEVVNAGLRAEDELAEMELDAERREVVKTAAAKKGIKNVEDAQDAENTREGEDATDIAKSFQPDPVYGRSSFDEIRARNQAKARVEDRARKEEEEAKEASGTEEVRTGALTKFRDPNRQIQNPAVAKFYKEAESDMQEAPQMSTWERIGPSAVAVVLVVGFLAAVAMVYEEPQAKYRLLPELTTAQATVGTIVALNVLVYLGWRIPPLWKAFNKYMLFVVGAPRPLALFTAPFSHKELGHLLVNMVPLYVVGTHLHEDVGRAGFTALYIACGAFGFLGTLTTYTLANMLGVYTLGASGATMGLMAAYFWEHRGDAFRILGLPPDGVQGIVWLALLVGVHLAGVGGMFSAKNKIDMASHLAGLVTGIVGIELIQGSKRKESASNGSETEAETAPKTTQATVVKDLFSGQVIGQKVTK